jgi:hypothetical protein
MKPIQIILIVLFLNTGSYGQSVGKDSTAIKMVLADFFEVFTNPHMKYFDNNCDPDFELLEHGEVWRRAEIKSYVDNELSQPKSYERSNYFNFIKVNVHKKFAWVDYWNTAKFKNLKDNSIFEMKWLESIILEKRKGKWVLLQMHSTRVPKKN